MAIIGKLARLAYKMTPARKAALKKAVAASAKARAKKVGAKKLVKKSTAKVVKKSTAKRTVKKTVNRRVAKRKAQAAAITKTDSMKLARVSKGTKAAGQRRISTSNFKGAKGRALKKSTYKDRLASSRAKYKTKTSFRNKVGQKALGSVSPTGLWRRKYVDLTAGENVRRNISRNLKVSAAMAPAAIAANVAINNKVNSIIRPKKKKPSTSKGRN